MAQHGDEQPDESVRGIKGSADAVEALLAFIDIVRRRWIAVAATALLVIAVGFVFVSNLRPYWRATTTVVINTETPTRVLDSISGVNDQNLWSPVAAQEYAGTQQEIIRSRAVAEAALAKLDVADDPVFLGIDQINDEQQRKELAATIDPVGVLRSLVTTGQIRESKVLWISVEYPDPVVAADIANAVASAFLEVGDVDRTETGQQAKGRLADERAKAKERLEAAEKELDEFKQTNEITTISLDDRQNLITQNIQLLTAKVAEARSERIEREALFDEAKKLKSERHVASVSLLEPSERMTFDALLADKHAAEQEMAATGSKYLAAHPEHKRAKKRLDLANARLEEMAEDLVKSLRGRVRAARQTESRLKAALVEENEKALQLGRLEPRFRQLEREAKTTEEAYTVLARRDAEVEMTNRVENQRPIELLDQATVPVVPVRPRKGMLLAGMIVLGLVLGAALAVGLDLRDHRIRSVRDLERLISDFGLQVLGQLPVLSADPLLGSGNVKAQRRQRDLYSFLHPQSRMSENCRGIRTSLAFSLPPDTPQALMVTSPGSGDGKSATAINLAISYCQANKRVMLVDADMRRPRLHQLFPPPVDHGEVGLSAILQGRGTLEQGRLEAPEGAPENLTVLCCGDIPGNPAELLEGAAWRRLIHELKEKYDVVIVDCPPLLPVTDPRIIAPQVDGVIVVARCGRTTRAALRTALGMLRQSDTNLLGTVLNQVDPRSEGRYYGYGYGYKNTYYNTYGAREA